MSKKVWMITGAGRGLGRAFAKEAAEHGDSVIAAIRKINDADPLMKNENVLPVIMDVTKKEEIPRGKNLRDRFVPGGILPDGF